MKKILKKFTTFALAAAMLTACFGLAACEDLQTLEVKVSANGTEYTMTVDLYRHLAPETCKIIEFARTILIPNNLCSAISGSTART